MQKEYDKFFTPSLALETTRVKLRLMELSDIDALSAIAAPPEIWKYFTFELNKKEEMQQWVEAGLQERAEKKRMPFVIIVNKGPAKGSLNRCILKHVRR